jgi:predicted TIM-barrel fold metal-dependent hydrolase
MESTMKILVMSVVLMLGVVACDKHPQEKPPAASGPTNAAQVVSGPFSIQELKDFTALDPIDAHAHAFQNDPAFFAMFKKLNLHIVDIIVVDDQNPQSKELPVLSEAAWKFVRGSDGRGILCTTFDPYKLNDRGFAESSKRWLNKEFDQGAIAVKIWKNIGMEIKDAKGNYILPDNSVFAPIYKDIAAHHKTLIAHVADPSSAWAPMDPASPDYSYYKDNPVWYMYDKPHPASKEQILQARDHVLEQNPDLRVVGAHLGSMEADFNQLAQHLDRYPNFAVDLAARMPYMMLQPHADIIAFITKYQDKLIYATDNEFSPSDKVQKALDEWEGTYARDWRFLATNETVDYGGRKVQGLALPNSVLRKLYHDNAVHWFPGIVRGSH